MGLRVLNKIKRRLKFYLNESPNLTLGSFLTKKTNQNCWHSQFACLSINIIHTLHILFPGLKCEQKNKWHVFFFLSHETIKKYPKNTIKKTQKSTQKNRRNDILLIWVITNYSKHHKKKTKTTQADIKNHTQNPSKNKQINAN